MILPDVNVLIYAHREDTPDHERYADWLQHLVSSDEPYALSELVLSGFIRIVTNRKIFDPPTPLSMAVDFCNRLLERPNAVVVRPAESHWALFVQLIEDHQAKAGLVADAYHAALAIEHGCLFVSADRDFACFADLRWQHPLNADDKS